MKLIVCGARAWWDRQAVKDALSAMHQAYGGINLVVHGGCRGPDVWAGEWAEQHHIQVLVFPADWDGEGKAAGFKRNKRMVDAARQYQLDGVLAFRAGEARGTNHTVTLALLAELRVWVVDEGIRSIRELSGER